MSETKSVKREALLGGIGVSLCCVVMLLWALRGHPPYSFFSILKITVAFGAAFAAMILVKINRVLIPLALILVGRGMVELFGHMRRAQWIPYDWAAVILFLMVVAILSATMMKHEPR